MAALDLDGELLPFQQPVQFKHRQGYHLQGWPGLTQLTEGAHITRVERWFPDSGADTSVDSGSSSIGAKGFCLMQLANASHGGPAVKSMATRAPACAHGLLVIVYETYTDTVSDSRWVQVGSGWFVQLLTRP
jgi:hypothetical protein